MPSSKNVNGNGHFPQKLKNFFRINSFASIGEKAAGVAGPGAHGGDGTHHGSSSGSLKLDSKSSFRQSKFFSTVGRLRSTTVASEGNALEETLSPTAHANPYFAHQGQPGLRHHNEGRLPSPHALGLHAPSWPPSRSRRRPRPPVPILTVDGIIAADEIDPSAQHHQQHQQQATSATKEELARKLRRVASAPNAQGLFSKGKGSGGDSRPATAELGKEPLVENKTSSQLGLVDANDRDNNAGASAAAAGATTKNGSLAPPGDGDDVGALVPPPNRTNIAFRRTYSSNSIKVRNVEVGPQSFDKIKLIGKGDVGKVYLVREKKSGRLYAMKGRSCFRNGHFWPC